MGLVFGVSGRRWLLGFGWDGGCVLVWLCGGAVVVVGGSCGVSAVSAAAAATGGSGMVGAAA